MLNQATNKISAHSLFNFQDAEANSDIKHEANSEEEDITNVDIVPREVTSCQLPGGTLAVNVGELFNSDYKFGQKKQICDIARHMKTK